MRIDLQRAEEAAESELLFVRQRLVGEHENAVAVESRLDLGKDFRHDRLGQVDTSHLGAEIRVKRSDINRHVAPHPSAGARNMSRDAATINSVPMSTCDTRAIADWLVDGARSATQPQHILAELCH